ncbi:P-loop containing nucleoside triphosphate hydrolase protein [Mollisia scopiformis]|uniref:p-loop containing nucleoside triphosphate hydrolase protein n=1 Tax=Mollisia scopiformis TaxID=149040 RepID=A0A194XDZ6_MOLSC|nr:P-loop containing nucleoside triphosphate hydrolase protein [Mollisia scopiformis]KUJ17972.1 P-loop containing nucleoside triphosphate hydrolase protein [Mollisia scopiformis]
MATEPEYELVRATASILAWYDSTRPMYIDLVGDYAGKELFLVEGDSLLRECFDDERIDFDGGFQLLHAVYVVERFLENLIKRHCQFHVAFFDENAQLCVPLGKSDAQRARYLLARAVIKRHLMIRLPKSHPSVLVKSFPSLHSSEFSEYLQDSPIHFVMTHDGSSKESRFAVETPEGEEQELRRIPKDEKYTKRLFRGIIWWFNTHKLNVALINRIEFRDSKVFTMIVESFRPSSREKLVMTSSFVDAIKATQDQLNALHPVAEFPFENSDMKRLSDAMGDEEISESYCLSIYGVSRLLKQEDCDEFLASAYILHSIALKHMPISQRRLPLVTFDDDFEEQINQFLTSLSMIIRCAIDSPKWPTFMDHEDIELGAVDIIDGRLFRAVIQAMCDGSLKGVVPRAAQPDWELLSGLIADLTDDELSIDGSPEPTSSKTSATKSDFVVKNENLFVLPFSNPVLDKHLECIHVETDKSLPRRLGALKIYRETTHWHNHRKPLDVKTGPPQKVSKWRNPLRTNQFYMKEMTTYAASLTGAKGKALEPETVTVGPKQLIKFADEVPEKSASKSKKESAEPQNKGGPAKKGTKKGAAGLSKKDQMIADNKERKGGAESDKAFAAWSTVMKDLDAVSDEQDRYLRTIQYLNNLDAAKTTYLETDIYTYVLQSLLNWWASYCKVDKKNQGYHVVALIWTTIRSICTSKAPVSKDTVQHMTKICTLLGIPDSMDSYNPSPSDRTLSFYFKFPPITQDIRITMSQTEFQLDYCGPYMDRMLDAKPDPRVGSFVPDGWQRDVLDQLDANKSVFVVAPTSAGKTFISFYAMEQVLRADNDGVLVYVAPTKALVNQIAAEIQGRFSKKFPVPGKGVWAIHTRDYRVNNPTGCQILVTVPHILQIMLLSPSNAKSWAPKVRRIIFDEIHCIGQAEDGVVWEQLLLLSPCPIVALSATVGNPAQFSDWLTVTQKSSGSELKMIQHGTRYSDLRKYMYQPPQAFRFSGLGTSYGVGLGLDGLDGFSAFHPVASLVEKSRGMPDDLALEPRDCLSLWKAMVKCQTEKYRVPDSISPSKSLPKCIRKADIFAWEKAIKKVLLQWMGDRNSPFDKVVQELSMLKITGETEPNQPPSSTTSSVTEGDHLDKHDLKSTTLPLLYQLHKRRALPAILFNYDRSQCEDIGCAVLAQLVEAETRWKEGPQWKKKMEGYEKYQQQKDKKSRKPVKPVKKSKDDEEDGGSKLDRMRDESSEGASVYDLFDPEEPQAEFSFANPKQLQKAELHEYVRALRWKNVREELIKLLRRGIGVHHAGMNRKYRQCVEMLFRKGFLRVVIATGTLSLGINMPCATVVFSGDSVFLTALNFRQAAGRSGRRGFDLLGNVVFQGIPTARASRLLSSRLPEMTGHFPLTTTLVLRLFTLLNDSGNSKYAVQSVNALLSQPRLYMGGQSFKEQVLHHLRFSIEYLRRNDLLGPNGEPVNFTSCVSHLYYTENSSFAFHALLKGGFFHTLCADIDTKTTIVLYQMMLVLSHLFGRRVVREIDDPEQAEKIKRSSSMVYLPAMPEEAANILRAHNKDTLDVFTTYVKTFAEQHVKEEERRLPLTHVPVGKISSAANGKTSNGHAKANGTAEKKQPDAMDFLPSLPRPHARSAFVALSGLGDTFSTIEDLCSSTPEGVFLEAAVVPHLELHPDETRSPLNAYLLDFYMHGSVVPLDVANGIRKADVWFLLNDFSMILATITTSLAIYLGLDSGTDPEMLDVMGSGDAAENDADEKVAAETIPDAPVANKTVTPDQTFQPKKNRKVAEDWDAGEDALVAEEDFLKSRVGKEMEGTDDEEYEKLMNVYKAFKKLKTEFDEKFWAIFA